jgi:large subunit ribosomal protein L15
MDLQTVTSKGTRYTRARRVGRGTGSGRGKTCGRGHKGAGQRSGFKRRPGFEGGQMPIYRRVPKRGFTNARFRTEYTVINVEALNAFDDGSTVDITGIIARGLTSLNTPLLKVLGNGELTTKLTVQAQKFSVSAAAKIVAAGGEVVELDSKGRVTGEASARQAAAPETEQPATDPAEAERGEDEEAGS